MAKKVVWLMDIHLNFLNAQRIENFIGLLRKESPDYLLVGGDISEASSVCSHLQMLERSLDSMIYFVLGNHDFYRGSIAKVKDDVRKIVSDRLVFLDDVPYVPLSRNVALVGHSSWADGRLGDYTRSDVVLNDYILIEELSGLTKEGLLQKLNGLGDEAAAHLRSSMKAALARYPKVLCLTHVPPFRESCWHEGKISSDDLLPHFACKAVGDVLWSAMESHPDSHLTVLCGHTHSDGKARILDNLEVITGSAEYGKPKIQQVIYV